METGHSGELAASLAGCAAFGLMAIGILVERFIPAVRCPIRSIFINLAYVVPSSFLRTFAVSVVTGGTVLVTNMLGGGVIVLPSEGWPLVPAVALFTVVTDFAEYVYHRMSHRIPVLWAMHSLHHSDEAMNISTTPRHFWLEQAIKSVTVFLLAGLVLRANPDVVFWYGVVSLVNMLFHMNIPLGWGRGWFLLNSPQYHRIHHSSLEQHLDKNFAAVFPIFDVIFRTAYRPRHGEFPPTGLYDGDKPRGVIEAVVWPVRGVYRTGLSRLRDMVRRPAGAKAAGPR